MIEKSWRKPNIKNRVESAVEAVVVKYAVDCPAHGQVRVSNELCKSGVFISPHKVRTTSCLQVVSLVILLRESIIDHLAG